MVLIFNIVLGTLILCTLVVFIKGLANREPESRRAKRQPRKIQAKEYLSGFLGTFLAEILWPLCMVILFIAEVLRRTDKMSKKK